MNTITIMKGYLLSIPIWHGFKHLVGLCVQPLIFYVFLGAGITLRRTWPILCGCHGQHVHCVLCNEFRILDLTCLLTCLCLKHHSSQGFCTWCNWCKCVFIADTMFICIHLCTYISHICICCVFFEPLGLHLHYVESISVYLSLYLFGLFCKIEQVAKLVCICKPTMSLWSYLSIGHIYIIYKKGGTQCHESLMNVGMMLSTNIGQISLSPNVRIGLIGSLSGGISVGTDNWRCNVLRPVHLGWWTCVLRH